MIDPGAPSPDGSTAPGALPGAASGTPADAPRFAGLRYDVWWVAGLLGLVTLALVLRVGDLGPPSLWLDDAWLAVGVRGDAWEERLRVVVSAPGFVVALFTWLEAVGFDEVAAQVPALAAGVGGVWATMGVARRGLALSRAASLLAGLVVATSPLHLTYSTRVKHYTLDALLTLLVLWAALAVLRRPERARRAVVLGVTAIAVTAVSGIVGLVGGAALAVAAAAALAEHRQEGEGSHAAVTAFACVVALGAWLAWSAWWVSTVLGSTVNDVMRAEHAELFLPIDDATAARTRLGDGVNVLIDGAVAGPVAVFAVLALAGVVAIVLRRDDLGRRGPWRALLLLAPIVGAVALAATQNAPWGLGRTELYLVPIIALLVGAAVDVVVPSRPARLVVASAGRRVVGLAVTIAVVVAAVAGGQAERRSYPVEDVASVVATWQVLQRPGDGLLVYSASRWAFGLYTDGDVSLVTDDRESRGFHVEVDDPAVTLLQPTSSDGLEQVTEAIAARDRVWLLGSHRHDDWDDIIATIRADGFTRARIVDAEGARLVEFVRN